MLLLLLGHEIAAFTMHVPPVWHCRCLHAQQPAAAAPPLFHVRLDKACQAGAVQLWCCPVAAAGVGCRSAAPVRCELVGHRVVAFGTSGGGGAAAGAAAAQAGLLAQRRRTSDNWSIPAFAAYRQAQPVT